MDLAFRVGVSSTFTTNQPIQKGCIMGSLRSLRGPNQVRVGALKPQKFTNSKPAPPDLSVAEARHYGFDLTRYRIVRVLEIQDCYRDVLSRLLGRIDIRSSEDMDVEYYLSDN